MMFSSFFPGASPLFPWLTFNFQRRLRALGLGAALGLDPTPPAEVSRVGQNLGHVKGMID